MISSKIWRAIALSTCVISGLTLDFNHQVLAGVDLSEDKLNTEKSLQWGGEGLPFNEVVTVRDSLVNSIVGKLVIDRHGEDDPLRETSSSGSGLDGLVNAFNIKAPFAGPRPGRMTIVTLWGSKEEGCFVKAFVHNAPKTSANASLVPVKMEVGVGTQIIRLTPASQRLAKVARGNYTYTNNKISRTAPMYFAENTFAVNAKVADLLRNAPPGNAKVRLTFNNGDAKVFEIGKKNVSQWRESYGYNSSCKAKG
jgi:hypothetical protein